MPRIHPARETAARRYAAADKSDPFAFARAITHLRGGLCEVDAHNNPADYDAVEGTETRFLPPNVPGGDPRPYSATIYTSRKRP